MADIIRIEDIARYDGQEVTIQGWLQLKSDKGKLQFLRVRDGTGVIQAVVFRNSVSPEVFDAAKRLPLESSLIITGAVRGDPRGPGIPGGFEVGVSDLQVVQESAEFPIAPKEHGVEFLMDNRHLWLRSSRQWAILRVRATIVKAMRDWLDDNGFTLVDTPILTPSAAEGTSTLFKTDFHGEDAFLAQTGQLYNEANIFSVGKTYCFGPTFRAEKSKTRRHLQEFWMVEPEIAFCKLEGLLEIEEQYISYVVQTTLRERANELKMLERDTSALEKVIPPFPRISYDEAVAMINGAAAKGVVVPPNDEPLPPIEWGGDFGAPHETYVAGQFERPVFVHHYPSAVKAFYMEPEPGRSEVCRSADLLAPEGYGEIIGGSERMSDPDVLLASIDRHGLPRDAYNWYVDLRRYGSVPHSGFGLGVERTVSWICGLDHIRETTRSRGCSIGFAPESQTDKRNDRCAFLSPRLRAPSKVSMTAYLPSFVLIFAIGLTTSLVVTPWAMKLGQRQDITDRPGGRRKHRGIVPRLGGIALYVGFTIAVLGTVLLPAHLLPPRLDPKEMLRVTGLLVGTTAVFIFGLLDDRYQFSAWPQYIAQLVSALIALAFIIFIERINNPVGPGQIVFPWPVVAALTIFWFMGMINTVNWLDGLDGLAAGVSAIVAVFLAIHMIREGQLSVALLPVALLGTTLGFLPYNFNPAKIFMGSSGSYFLGWAVAALGIMGGAKVATVLLTMGLPIMDVAWLIYHRWKRGGRPGFNGRDHLHHRLLDIGFTQRQIVLSYYAWCAIFGATALVLENRLFKLIAMIVLFGVATLVLYWADRQPIPKYEDGKADGT